MSDSYDLNENHTLRYFVPQPSMSNLLEVVDEYVYDQEKLQNKIIVAASFNVDDDGYSATVISI